MTVQNSFKVCETLGFMMYIHICLFILIYMILRQTQEPTVGLPTCSTSHLKTTSPKNSNGLDLFPTSI